MKLWRYIQGFRKGKDAHQLEKEAMSDPFLAHALRGYDKVEGDHLKQIEQLQKEVRRKGARKPSHLRVAAVAASILIVIGVGSYFLIQQAGLTDEMQLAVFHEINTEAAAPVPEPPIDKPQQEVATPNLPVAKKSIEEAPTPVAEAVGDDNMIAQVQRSAPIAPVQEEVESAEVMEVRSMAERNKPDETANLMADSTDEKNINLDEVVVTGYATQKKASVVGSVSSVRTAAVTKGKVTDDSGDPLPGVSVSIPGTTRGTITDADGYFELETGDKKKIRVAYIGYESIDLSASTSDTLYVAMREDESTLDEVVVTGYGTRRITEPEAPKPVIGNRKYKKYIKENLVQPDEEGCRDVKGKVVLSFYVDASGRPTKITVTKSLCPAADEEAIRLLTEGPDWTYSVKRAKLTVKF